MTGRLIPHLRSRPGRWLSSPTSGGWRPNSGLIGWVRKRWMKPGDFVTVGGEKVPEFIVRLRARSATPGAYRCHRQRTGRGSGVGLSSRPASRVRSKPPSGRCGDSAPRHRRHLRPTSRWRYAFTTCVPIAGRYTVSRGIPYDRAQTSLVGFPLCASCSVEYYHRRPPLPCRNHLLPGFAGRN